MINNILKFSLLLFIISSITYALLLFISSNLDNQAQKNIVQYSEQISLYKSNNGDLPVSINKLNVKTTKLFKIIPANKISYRVNKDHYTLYYNQWPLGPRHLYDSKSSEWSFEE